MAAATQPQPEPAAAQPRPAAGAAEGVELVHFQCGGVTRCGDVRRLLRCLLRLIRLV
jgi:hypothetical protein